MNTNYVNHNRLHEVAFSAVTKALIGGGGGVHSYIRVLSDEFHLKSIVIRVDFKRNSYVGQNANI